MFVSQSILWIKLNEIRIDSNYKLRISKSEVELSLPVDSPRVQFELHARSQAILFLLSLVEIQ